MPNPHTCRDSGRLTRASAPLTGDQVGQRPTTGRRTGTGQALGVTPKPRGDPRFWNRVPQKPCDHCRKDQHDALGALIRQLFTAPTATRREGAQQAWRPSDPWQSSMSTSSADKARPTPPRPQSPERSSSPLGTSSRCSSRSSQAASRASEPVPASSSIRLVC